jgi:hypothetical protein
MTTGMATIGIIIATTIKRTTSRPIFVEQRDRQTDMDGPLVCSSLTLEREEQRRK